MVVVLPYLIARVRQLPTTKSASTTALSALSSLYSLHQIDQGSVDKDTVLSVYKSTFPSPPHASSDVKNQQQQQQQQTLIDSNVRYVSALFLPHRVQDFERATLTSIFSQLLKLPATEMARITAKEFYAILNAVHSVTALNSVPPVKGESSHNVIISRAKISEFFSDFENLVLLQPENFSHFLGSTSPLDVVPFLHAIAEANMSIARTKRVAEVLAPYIHEVVHIWTHASGNHLIQKILNLFEDLFRLRLCSYIERYYTSHRNGNVGIMHTFYSEYVKRMSEHPSEMVDPFSLQQIELLAKIQSLNVFRENRNSIVDIRVLFHLTSCLVKKAPPATADPSDIISYTISCVNYICRLSMLPTLQECLQEAVTKRSAHKQSNDPSLLSQTESIEIFRSTLIQWLNAYFDWFDSSSSSSTDSDQNATALSLCAQVVTAVTKLSLDLLPKIEKVTVRLMLEIKSQPLPLVAALLRYTVYKDTQSVGYPKTAIQQYILNSLIL